MIGFKAAQSQKPNRLYLRFHQTISRAIAFNKAVYGNQKTKDNRQYRYEHAIRVAGMTQEIGEQCLNQYHMSWLLGILHDAKQDNPVLYGQKIDEVLQDLLPEEVEEIKKYVDQLSSDRSLNKGEQKKEQVVRASKLDVIPGYIKIFDKYDNCRRFLKDSCGKSHEQLMGYYAVSYLCYDAVMRNQQMIAKYLNEYIKQFFAKLRAKFESEAELRQYAEYYYKI